MGTAPGLSLARRAQLAVVAHIRHTYTEYDRILRLTSYPKARGLVENRTLCKLVEWRGNGRHGKPELEAVLQEVIVISDEEEATEDGNEEIVTPGDQSVEIVPSEPVQPNGAQTEPVNVTPIGSLQPDGAQTRPDVIPNGSLPSDSQARPSSVIPSGPLQPIASQAPPVNAISNGSLQPDDSQTRPVNAIPNGSSKPNDTRAPLHNIIPKGSSRWNEAQSQPVNDISEPNKAEPGIPDNEARPRKKVSRSPRKQDVIQPCASSVRGRRAAWQNAMDKYRKMIGQPPAETSPNRVTPSSPGFNRNVNYRQKSNAPAGRGITQPSRDQQILQSPSKAHQQPPVSVQYPFCFLQNQRFCLLLVFQG